MDQISTYLAGHFALPIRPSCWRLPVRDRTLLRSWHIHECRSSGRCGLALGVATGSFTWAVLTVLGLSALLATYAAALTVIKIAGGFYLLWLAYKSLKSALSKHDIEAGNLQVAGARPLDI